MWGFLDKQQNCRNCGTLCKSILEEHSNYRQIKFLKVYGNKGFKPASTFIVTMGSLDRWVSDNNTLNILVRKVVGHKKYNEDTFEHDIALLILAAEVPSNHPTVQPISLASQNPLVGQTCTISGWGTTFYKGPEPSRLQAANVNINSRSECNQAHRYDGGVLSGMFCAGGFTGMNISDSW